MISPHIQTEGLFPFLGRAYLCKLFGILLYKRFVYSLPFFNLFSQLFISVWTHGYIFYTLGYNPVVLDFMAQIAPALVIGSSFRCFLCSLDISPPMHVGFVLFVLCFVVLVLFRFQHFLILGPYKVFQAPLVYVLPQAQCLPRALPPFTGKQLLETKMCKCTSNTPTFPQAGPFQTTTSLSR